MAIRGRRAPFPQIIKTLQRYAPAAPTTPIGRVITPAGAFASQAAANIAHRLPSRIIIGRLFVEPVRQPPIGRRVVTAGQFAAQAATNYAHRPLFQPNPNTPVVPRPRRAGLFVPLLPRVPDSEDRNRAARHTEILSNVWNSLLVRGYIRKDGLEAKIVGGAYEMPRPPRQEDDASIRAQVGNTWVDTVGLEAYICISNAFGAAVWKKIT
jgi:hypothetical protein